MLKYGWAPKNKKAENSFTSMTAIKLICCISPWGVEAF